MILIALLLLLFNNKQEINCQESPSVLLVDLLQFHNPIGITNNGQCCDGSYPTGNFCPIPTSCNLYTIVCLDLINSGIETDWTSCPLGSKSFKLNINSTNLFNYYSNKNRHNHLPIKFDLPRINDNSIRIKIFVFYHNTTMLLNQFYTTFRIDMSHPSLNDGSFQQLTLIDLTKKVPNINQMIVAVKSYCQETFYGKQCSIQCIPNDDCTSSYTCDRTTGLKVCSKGWHGSECSIHNSSSICSQSDLQCFNGGFCRSNQSTCCCPHGFTGVNCQYLSTCISDVTCLNGGQCNSIYDDNSRTSYFVCNCAHGYTGLYCQDKNECSAPNTCLQGHFSCNSQGEKVCLNGWGPMNVCKTKVISPLFDPECPISTGCQNGGSCFNGSCCCPINYSGRLCETYIDPCTNNPCQNNALCLPTSTGYKCLCSNSIYTGSLCEINQNPCQYSPCQNGICQLLGNTTSFTCICYPGYTGQFCHIKINYCLSEPCLNNGICSNVATGFICTCTPNFTGTTCSIELDPNRNNHTDLCPYGLTNPPDCLQDINECLLEREVCKNNGICVNTQGSYYCQCTEHYQGNDCTIPIDPCSSDPCMASNSISCSSIIDNNTYSIDFNCTCRIGFTGKHCEIEMNPCETNPCLNGRCIELTPSTWSCVCEPGWTGLNCEENINECLSNPCLNAALCIDGVNNYECKCLPGFIGDMCQTNMNPCLAIPCHNNGTCISSGESFSCICSIGWTGGLCEVNVNECSYPLSCHPNATCVDLPGSYECVCPTWLTGTRCLTAIDQCESYSCLNNGICVNNYGSLPLCHCQPGFTGVHCEVNIDDCHAGPCHNNGTCIDQINSFLCLCSSGYTGLRCQTRISQCHSSSCLNGGTCRDLYLNDNTESYHCLCPPYFTGTRCEQILNPCLSFPCLHGSCTPMLSSYKCQCNMGYIGENCEIMIDHCQKNSCGLNGNCTNLATRFSCCCAPGFTGSQCERLIDICSTNPCSIEGVDRCISMDSRSFKCLCKSGYSGRFCEINTNECLSEPCLHGGVCVDFENSYQCICPLAYTGANCQYLQDKCVGIQCLNGGKCINNGTNLTCSCAQGYHGENCELIIDYCQSQPCLNGGICSNKEYGAKCLCPNGITGSFCEIIIDQCKSKPCLNNGICKSLIDKYVCLCSNGYMGDHCEYERNECEPVNPCLNSGRCIDKLNNFSCICNTGFTGSYCETQIDQCQSNPCLNGAICRTLINGYKCDCPLGYTGTTCSTMINHCSSNPCSNNGICISLINDYRCVCLHDYTGYNCEINSNECLSNPCLNNGTCSDGIWNYTCQCPIGFTGSNCQIQINYCSSSPCLRGLCIPKVNGYECICPSSSYAGVHCEIQINKCSSNPCLNHGTCIDSLDKFVCICPPWYSGLICSERIDPCSKEYSACANNGTCITDLNVKPFGYTCECLPGFTGQMCEINIDDCQSQLCQYGACIDKINGFICQCYEGYDGILCDNVIDKCLDFPCENNGTCNTLMNSYDCRCPSDYYGKNCEKKLTESCSNNPCLNSGTCLLTYNGQFECLCLHGYTGDRCEIKLNPCYSNPCHHGACHNMDNGFYYCSCSLGYTGFNCQYEINPCDSLPCLNNGLCAKTLTNTYNCTCLNGYSGRQCQHGNYHCHSGPCLNNGVCNVVDNHYQCACLPGLTGNRCEIDIDECESMPCQNSGICLQNKLNHYQCLCPIGYTGFHCESTIDPCLSISCLNNGTCIRTSLTHGTCSCLPGYTGLSCQHQINTCLSAPCLNGTCVPMINSYRCNCYPGYTGERCNQLIDYCSSNPCFNNGTCQNQATTFACQCPFGFQGRTCVIRIQACQSFPCLNGGTCYDTGPGIYKCSCPSSYLGEFCQLKRSFCHEMPCQNNAVCLDTLNGYQCICQPGYNGINCTNQIQPCLSEPCFNNGTCRNINNGLGYQCFCDKNYGGLQCEFEINRCSSNPCQNHGTCISHQTSFTCLCPKMYTGRICQTPINNCSLNTCKYGIPVMTSATSCSCICSKGYTGNRCDVPINPCLNQTFCVRGQCNYLSPGLANCTCPIGYSGLRCDTKLMNDACSSCPCVYGQCRALDDINKYVCDCYQGYTGKQCDVSIDLCKPSPCLYGQCLFDNINGYRCQCLPGAKGRNCSELIDTCSSNPCLNSGVCIQGLNRYQCVCQAGYAGIHCEILINQCTSLTCLNNGTCVNLPTNPPTARCNCPSLFTGIQCQYPYLPCASQPCQNLGTCISNSISSYTCLCPNGFSGKNCQINVHVCESNPCQNGGSCTEPAPYYYICQCEWPFYGRNCEFVSDPCLSFPCRGPSSRCLSTPMFRNYTCLCSKGFEGSTCSTPVDPCRSVPCLNGGTCIRTNSWNYSCSCQLGHRGKNCEIEINPCWNFSCRNGIAIRTSPIHCECQCSKSYYGKQCEINICEKNPCLFGECISNGSYSYTCNCPSGYQFIMGVCVDINECTTIPGICENGGRCLNLHGSYSCFCKSGFYGKNCENFDPCRSVPCLNGGNCLANESYPYWQCNCSSTYTGLHCETPILSCSSNPCRTGDCINLPNNEYKCMCPPTITGTNCDKTILPCDRNPCFNNATCLTLSLTNYTCVCPTLYTGPKCSEKRTICLKNICHMDATCLVNQETGEEYCKCPYGRYGTYCESMSPCASNPCQHGTCINKDEITFECLCQTGFQGKTCDVSYDICDTNPCLNGGTCSNLGNGLFVCACTTSFTGSDCGIPFCDKNSCFNGGICSVANSSIQCSCPCGFTGSRCEIPSDLCSLTICQNNGTKIENKTTCQCSCSCPSTFSGHYCQISIMPTNRTYTGKIIIPMNRTLGSSWQDVEQCIDDVWNRLNNFLICPTPYTIVKPTFSYPYCYRLNQENQLRNQFESMKECEKQHAQLVWFESIDELEKHLIPNLYSLGLIRDFWTSGIYDPITSKWTWLLTKNQTQINIHQFLIQHIENSSRDHSLYVSFDQTKTQHLTLTTSNEHYSTLCKLSATRLLLNNQTRSIAFRSSQISFQNQSKLITYYFDYNIHSSIPASTQIRQPTNTHYSSMCGAISDTSESIEPYIIDICGFFSSITDPNVELIMELIGQYYTNHQMSSNSKQTFLSTPLNIENYLTISGNVMTRIYFIITRDSSTILGSNIEPLVPIDNILRLNSYQNYKQCIPHISLNILLKLEFCTSLNEISQSIHIITKAISHAIEQSNVNVILKGAQEGFTTTGQQVTIAYFLITVDGLTYNQTIKNNSIILSIIKEENSKLLCSNQTNILLIEKSIRNFYSDCSMSHAKLEEKINNAFHENGIYTMNISIFGIEEVVDNYGNTYMLPNIFIQQINGTWLDPSIVLDEKLIEIFEFNQLKQMKTEFYYLSKSYAYLYSNNLSNDDRNSIKQLILTTYNQQNSIQSNRVKILYEDVYLNLTSYQSSNCIYLFLFHDEQQIDARHLSLGSINRVSSHSIKQRHLQRLMFNGKINQLSVERILNDYWRNPYKQGLINININILEIQEYLILSSKRLTTRVTYALTTTDGSSIGNTCFDSNLLETKNRFCHKNMTYLSEITNGYIPSTIDIKHDNKTLNLDHENISKLISSLLQRINIYNKILVSSLIYESRFNLNMSLITRIYYLLQPNQIVKQEQIHDHFKNVFPSYELHPNDQLSISRDDAFVYVANVSLPLTDSVRIQIENYLTMYNSEYGKAKVVYAEALNINQTQFYLIFLNGTEIFGRCDFPLYYPNRNDFVEENDGLNKIYLQQSTFFVHSSSLIQSLREIWSNENQTLPSINLKNQIQYICSDGKRSVQINYLVQNTLIKPSNDRFENYYGRFSNSCISYKIYSIYLIEPRLSNKDIYRALRNAWHQSNKQHPIDISGEFFLDSSYLTDKNQTLTRLMYTIKQNPSSIIEPLSNSIDLSCIYYSIPYKQYTIHLGNKPTNSTVLSMINKALRLSWSQANSYLFSSNDIYITSIEMISFENQQHIRMNYMIGLRFDDIGDYSQPTEKIYVENFDNLGLETSIFIHYIPRNIDNVSLNNDQISYFPFDYRSTSSFYSLDWWVILIIIVAVLAIWLILCLICYMCFHKRSKGSDQHKISTRLSRRIDVLAREQQQYIRPSLSSFAFDGPYAESIDSSFDEHQRMSMRTISTQPELRVRRLSEQDWAHFGMNNPYGLSSITSDTNQNSSISNNRPI